MSAATAVAQPHGGRCAWSSTALLAALPRAPAVPARHDRLRWQASRHGTPWLFTDELEFTQLARSVAETGELARRGEPLAGQFSLYPYLTAPAWWIDDTKTALRGREADRRARDERSRSSLPTGSRGFVVSRPAALFAALGATSIPAFVYTSLLVEEPLAYSVGDALRSTSLRAGTCAPRSARTSRSPSPPQRSRRCSATSWSSSPRSSPASRSSSAGSTRALVRCGMSWHPRDLRRRSRRALAVVLVLAEQRCRALGRVATTSTRDFPERLLEYGVWAAGAFTIGIAVLPVVAALAFLVPGTAGAARPRRRRRSACCWARDHRLRRATPR